MKKISLAVLVLFGATSMAFATPPAPAGNTGGSIAGGYLTGNANWGAGSTNDFSVGSSITNAGSQVSGAFNAAGNGGAAYGQSSATNVTIGGSLAGTTDSFGLPLAGSIAGDYSNSVGQGSFNTLGAGSVAQGTYGAGGNFSTFASLNASTWEYGNFDTNWGAGFVSWNQSTGGNHDNGNNNQNNNGNNNH